MNEKFANARRGERGMRGFTLVELMIVVVIVGILAAVAYPSYQNQVRKTKRADGKAMLLETAQGLERCYTRFGRYNHASCTVATDLPDPSEEGHYIIDDTALTAASFTLVATPQGDQADDACGTLSLTSTGVQTSGSGSADCW